MTQTIIPKDEAEYLFADPELEAMRPEYTEAIKRMVAERKINASMLGDIKELFFGTRRVSLETTSKGVKRPNPNIVACELRALYLEMDPSR